MAGHIADAVRIDWCTPEYIVSAVKDMFGIIQLDPCSNTNSIVGAVTNYILPTNDGLKDSWDYSTIYVNPPFGPGLDLWVKRCVDAYKNHGSEIILLLPAAVETKWWQQLIFPNSPSICFLNKRIKFIGAESGAPMPCAIVYFGDDSQGFFKAFKDLGTIR